MEPSKFNSALNNQVMGKDLEILDLKPMNRIMNLGLLLNLNKARSKTASVRL